MLKRSIQPNLVTLRGNFCLSINLLCSHDNTFLEDHLAESVLQISSEVTVASFLNQPN